MFVILGIFGLIQLVYFIYPETANVRLEDMNALFGDATSVMPTPSSRAETGSLVERGSPVPSFTLGEHGADSAIPGLDIDPPDVQVKDGKPILSRHNSDNKEGLGGWISNMVQRTRGNGEGDSGSVKSGNAQYKRLGQHEADDE